MTPDEKKLLLDLFERIGTAGTAPRDREAEAFIDEAVRRTPFAPYVMAQTVIVQEQALKGAAARIEELEERVRALESKQEEGAGSFLGGIGKSLFGETRTSVPVTGRSGSGVPSFGTAPQPPQQGAVWNRGGAYPPQGGFARPGSFGGRPGFGGGGGFLSGALATAAGVAGGALLFQGLSHLFSDPARAAALDPNLAGLNPDMASLGDIPEPPRATDEPGFLSEGGGDSGPDGGGFGGDGGGFDSGFDGGGDWT